MKIFVYRSVILLGCHAFTVYSEPNHQGKAMCIMPRSDTQCIASAIWNLDKARIKIESVKEECHADIKCYNHFTGEGQIKDENQLHVYKQEDTTICYGGWEINGQNKINQMQKT